MNQYTISTNPTNNTLTAKDDDNFVRTLLTIYTYIF